MFRILIVDDNPGDALIIKTLIQASHRALQVLTCTDGCEALDFLNRRGHFAAEPAPSLILLDINMPGMSGLDVLVAIKADPAVASIPVAILSSSSASADVERAYRAHANCYLQKPTTLDDAERLVRAIEAFWMDVAVLPFSGGCNSEAKDRMVNGSAAGGLIETMRAARLRQLEADKRYRKAMEIAVDTDYSADGSAGLRTAAREYREALNRYYAAVRAWSEYLQGGGNELPDIKSGAREDGHASQ